MESHDTIPHDLPKFRTGTLILVAAAVVLVFAILAVVGFIPRHHRIAERDEMAQQIAQEKPVVQVVKPTQTEKNFEITLPADVRPFAMTSLYARINGYLDHWAVDINDRVTKGQELALIAAPDTDADYNQAVANLAQAKANVVQQQTNLDLANTTYNRYKALLPTGGVTQQQLDQYDSSMEQAKATLVAAQANVNSSDAAMARLEALRGFEKIYAPFDGVVTARNYDAGALISASNIGAGQQLFDIAEDDKLRVFVNVPQSSATLLKFDTPVFLTVRNYPNERFKGNLARSAGVLDPATRTLRTELDFDNKDHRLYAGMYGQGIFEIVRDKPVLTIPTSAMLFEANGTQVATVGEGNKIHFQKIVVGRDFGTELEVLTGLNADDRIVSNPGEKIAEGSEVVVNDGGQDNKPAKTAAATPRDVARDRIAAGDTGVEK